MILVNNEWEQVYDLQDISKIIRQEFNSDLADEMDKLIPTHTDEDYSELEWKLEKRENEIRSLEDELYETETELRQKDKEIEELEEKIRELENETENFEEEK